MARAGEPRQLESLCEERRGGVTHRPLLPINANGRRYTTSLVHPFTLHRSSSKSDQILSLTTQCFPPCESSSFLWLYSNAGSEAACFISPRGFSPVTKLNKQLYCTNAYTCMTNGSWRPRRRGPQRIGCGALDRLSEEGSADDRQREDEGPGVKPV